MASTPATATARPPSSTPPVSSTTTSVPSSTTSHVPLGPSSVGDGDGFSALQKVMLYETKTRLVLTGADKALTGFRILVIDRTCPLELKVVEDGGGTIYTHAQCQARVNALCKPEIEKKHTLRGIMGFIRLPRLYLMVITKKKKVGQIGGRYIYGIAGTTLISVTHKSYERKVSAQKNSKYKQLISSIDFTKDYYFSYFYDLTHTLQHNMMQSPAWTHHDAPTPNNPTGNSSSAAAAAAAVRSGPTHMRTRSGLPTSPLRPEPPSTAPSGPGPSSPAPPPSITITPHGPPRMPSYNEMFLWNLHLAREFLHQLPHASYWLVPVIHGFFSQASIRIGRHDLALSLMARRSRHFAGTRYIKRGVSQNGHVANEVETELILHDRAAWVHGQGAFCSFVVHRGSIPLFWSQDNPKSPRPEIIVYKFDKELAATHKHFNGMFERYGSPLVVLSLIKKEEKSPNEMKLGNEFASASAVLATRFRNEAKKGRESDRALIYRSYDFLNSRKAGLNVLSDLKKMMSGLVESVGFFFQTQVLIPTHAEDSGRVWIRGGFKPGVGAASTQPPTPVPTPMPSATTPAVPPPSANKGEDAPLLLSSISENDEKDDDDKKPTAATTTATAAATTMSGAAPLAINANLATHGPPSASPVRPAPSATPAVPASSPTSLSSSSVPSPASPSASEPTSPRHVFHPRQGGAPAPDPLSPGRNVFASAAALAQERALFGARSPKAGYGTLGTNGEDYIEKLNLAEAVHMPLQDSWLRQRGVVRINCIDCLDRTNVAQFVVTKTALRHMLRAVGVTSEVQDDLYPELTDILQNMFYKHGDRIANQYAGSGAMHKEALFENDKDGLSPLGAANPSATGASSTATPSSDSKTSVSTSASSAVSSATSAAAAAVAAVAAAVKKKEDKPKKAAAAKKGSFGQNALSAVKRYYSNNVTDVDKQCAFNLLLGAYVPDPEGKKPHIWELDVGMNHAESDQKFGHENDIFKVPYLSYILGARMGRFAYQDNEPYITSPTTTALQTLMDGTSTSTTNPDGTVVKGHRRVGADTPEERHKRRAAQQRLKQFLVELHDPSHMTSFRAEFEHEFNKPVYVATTLNPTFGVNPPATSATGPSNASATTSTQSHAHHPVPTARPNHAPPPPPNATTATAARAPAAAPPPSHPPVATTTTTTTSSSSATSSTTALTSSMTISASTPSIAPSSLSPPTTPSGSSGSSASPALGPSTASNSLLDDMASTDMGMGDFNLDRSRGRSAAMSVFSLLPMPSSKVPTRSHTPGRPTVAANTMGTINEGTTAAPVKRGVPKPPAGNRPGAPPSPPQGSGQGGTSSMSLSSSSGSNPSSATSSLNTSGSGAGLASLIAAHSATKQPATYTTIAQRIPPPHPMTLSSIAATPPLTQPPPAGTATTAGGINAPLRSGSPVRPRPPNFPPPPENPTGKPAATAAAGSNNGSSLNQRPAAPSTLPPNLVELLLNSIAQQQTNANDGGASEFARYIDTNRLYSDGVVSGTQYDQPIGAAYPSLPSSSSSSSSSSAIGASQLAEIILRLSADVKTVTDNVGAIQSTLRRRAPLVQPASSQQPQQQLSMSYREAQYQ